MKKIVLGMAAMAAVSVVSTVADAGEVKIGGAYRFQVMDEDNSLPENPANSEDFKAWRHQLILKMNMKTSEKTAAHMVWHVVDDQVVSGSGSSFLETRTIGTQSATVAGANWNDVRQLWVETEAFGVGVKAGEMPIQLNDSILVNDDGDSSFGAIVLSKSMGDITVVLADVRVLEGNAGYSPGANAYTNTGGYSAAGYNQTTNAIDSDEDDIDLYVAALLGKNSGIEWNATVAYADAQEGHGQPAGTFVTTNANESVENWWLAGTASTKMGGINMTGTLIYEAGYDGVRGGVNAQWDQMEGSGWMGALRLNGDTAFGGWNAYGFYGDEDFDSVTNRPNWSKLYDSYGSDLMHFALTSSNYIQAATAGREVHANDSGENSWGVGAGLSVKAGVWTIEPQLDYAAVTEDKIRVANVDYVAQVDDAWGASLAASTQIDKDATLTLFGAYVDPSDGDNGNQTAANNVGKADDMHTLLAQVAIAF